MKKIILSICSTFLITASSFAHYLWIETNPNGIINQEQEIRVYYGEYTYGVIEEITGEAFPKVSDFTLFLVDPSGKKIQLKTSTESTYYKANFIPSINGTYTVLLNNDKIDVIDFTQYDFGIFKTHYHSVAKIQVGDNQSETASLNKNGITVKDISENTNEIKLLVLFKNEVLPKNEVKIYVSDLWSKTLETNENGIISFKLPWNTKYIIETTHKEEVPGIYKNENYQFIWHCVTYTIPTN
ncbi:DUF4198 domain-containing protein [Lutibacter flavus]|uniref:Uncharacterized conserved protein, contains GH25 family domain n=1 Tax=Lutibacter flavus TaxID=691689 RepID=A0A238Z2K3_9FLAO|nr:ferredoxin [Lutibacter flavus]SNR77695.1 Uncharacterized conserved protein, contains GH25 family domain [Lutibacter flavus]